MRSKRHSDQIACSGIEDIAAAGPVKQDLVPVLTSWTTPLPELNGQATHLSALHRGRLSDLVMLRAVITVRSNWMKCVLVSGVL